MRKRKRRAFPEAADLPPRAGVYLLRHRITGDTYVGSSQCVRTRVRGHLGDLARGKHSNPRIQKLADAHGIQFDVSALELTGEADRYAAETRWCSELAPSLNQMHPPKRAHTRGGDTVFVSVRLPKSLVQWLYDFCDRHPLNPKPGRVMEMALTDWLDAHERELPAKPKGAK